LTYKSPKLLTFLLTTNSQISSSFNKQKKLTRPGRPDFKKICKIKTRLLPRVFTREKRKEKLLFVLRKSAA
ncbi:hypothetical protein, partial [Ileibacterium valens]|uniref:hypothetical protein n=1 Tax=Ileibacterium valens TaxID=1862668 RepID=UPI0025729969